jgi:predicted RNA-binding Zn ribbon-like protein
MPVSSEDGPEPPHQLGVVIDFVNTFDLETGIEELGTGSELAAWLSERSLLDDPGLAIREPQRTQALEFREALRALMAAHNGASPDPVAAAELEQVARRGQLAVRFSGDGTSYLSPAATGLTRALALLLMPVIESSADGSWERVKACRADDCLWAFYDHSRNRAGVWCDMAVCGNRAKVRAYRQRKPR